MRELNKLIYTTIKNDPSFKVLTGATATDPRIYKSRTPVKITVSDTYPAFAVYYKQGSFHASHEIPFASKNSYTYGVEVYGKKDTTVETICYRIEKLFEEERFVTDTFIVNYAYATRGTCTFDEGRELYVESMSIYLSHILTLDESS